MTSGIPASSFWGGAPPPGVHEAYDIVAVTTELLLKASFY